METRPGRKVTSQWCSLNKWSIKLNIEPLTLSRKLRRVFFRVAKDMTKAILHCYSNLGRFFFLRRLGSLESLHFLFFSFLLSPLTNLLDFPYFIPAFVFTVLARKWSCKKCENQFNDFQVCMKMLNNVNFSCAIISWRQQHIPSYNALDYAGSSKHWNIQRAFSRKSLVNYSSRHITHMRPHRINT